MTHDGVEALALGDAVAVMHECGVRQSGPVAEVFARPSTAEVARVVGVENVLPAEVIGRSAGLAEFRVGGVRLLARSELPPGAAHVAIRAEDVKLAGEDRDRPGPWNQLSGVVVSASPEGALTRVTLAPVSP